MKAKIIFTMLMLAALMAGTDLCAQPGGGRQPGAGGGGMRGAGGMRGGMGGSSAGAEVTYTAGTPINNLWKLSSDGKYDYIVGLHYCTYPVEKNYEQMGIYVPATYLTANADGTFSINTQGRAGDYTAATAPIVMPVNTPGYSAQGAPTGEARNVQSYIDAGFIYLWAGCRGRDHGAPTGVTDLKAALRYFRYLAASQKAVPGDVQRVFSFGMSGGGAQSAIFGASGNSQLYEPYLKQIGARTDQTDQLMGSMCWCPITNLDLADEAYEWNMGLTRSGLSDTESAMSKALAKAFADYINAIKLKHPQSGKVLTLTATPDGYYQGGSYYEYTMEVVNDAAARYNKYSTPSLPLTPYFITTDPKALSTFASQEKRASKTIGAFDNYQSMRSPENTLMGISGVAGHFDSHLADVVRQYSPDNYAAFTASLAADNRDAVGNNVTQRLMMYTPMYYLVDNSTYYPGGGTKASTVAPYWRIRTGIKQGDTALSTEMNLAIALKAHSDVKAVDFETIWGQGHTEAEDTGTSAANFIEWVKECTR